MKTESQSARVSIPPIFKGGSLAALLLALAAPLAHGADEAKSPWTWGGDLRLREVGIENANALDEANASAERHFQRYRLRTWGQYAPSDSLKLNGRVMWEGRHYHTPDIAAFDEWYSGAVMLDNLFVAVEKPGGLPLNLKLGRQDIFLGNGWLMADGTPIDGSRTGYLDALRSTWTLSPQTSLEAILIQQNAKTTLTLNGKDEDQTEQDEQGAIFYLRHKWNPTTDVDAYYFYKDNTRVTGEAANGFRVNNGTTFPSASDDGQVHALGARLETALTPQWKLRAEGALETGERNGRDLQAHGFNSRLTRSLGGAWNQRVHVGVEYLSGDDPGSTGKTEAFDPLWGRWPQWSELYGPYTYGMETRTGETTNLRRFNLGWAAKVHPTTEVSLDYHAVYADENSRCGAAGFSCSEKMRGHLLAAWVRSKFNKHVSGHLVAEHFWPGDYYVAPKGDEAYFIRAEMLLSW